MVKLTNDFLYPYWLKSVAKIDLTDFVKDSFKMRQSPYRITASLYTLFQDGIDVFFKRILNNGSILKVDSYVVNKFL